MYTLCYYFGTLAEFTIKLNLTLRIKNCTDLKNPSKNICTIEHWVWIDAEKSHPTHPLKLKRFHPLEYLVVYYCFETSWPRYTSKGRPLAGQGRGQQALFITHKLVKEFQQGYVLSLLTLKH